MCIFTSVLILISKWHDKGSYQIVVYDEGIAIQVSYLLSDPETEKREVDALLKLNKVLPMRKLMIISKDEERDITVNDVIIQVIPVWKWLLD